MYAHNVPSQDQHSAGPAQLYFNLLFRKKTELDLLKTSSSCELTCYVVALLFLQTSHAATIGVVHLYHPVSPTPHGTFVMACNTAPSSILYFNLFFLGKKRFRFIKVIF